MGDVLDSGYPVGGQVERVELRAALQAGDLTDAVGGEVQLLQLGEALEALDHSDPVTLQIGGGGGKWWWNTH